MKIIKQMFKADGKTHYAWMVFCPGCDWPHLFDDRWAFNGNLEKPTFTPSLLCNADEPARRCHSFVKDGKWQFLNDCHHALKGQTVDLPDLGPWLEA